ncbi:MAG: hypothetical protein R8G60_14205 [Roseovarius pacificus]|nr:hypothetical protein [Roseovarius pacificus]
MTRDELNRELRMHSASLAGGTHRVRHHRGDDGVQRDVHHLIQGMY